MDLKKILSFDLGPLPLSLAKPDGSLAKTTKSTLLHQLENLCSATPQAPSTQSVTIFDGMAVLQSISKPPLTFAVLAKEIFTRVTGPFSTSCARVDFVCDTYPDVNIKFAEHASRSTRGVLRMTITRGDQKCPIQWKSFLGDSSNKVSLVQFLHREWSSDQFVPQLLNRQVSITVGTDCHVLTSADGWYKILYLTKLRQTPGCCYTPNMLRYVVQS